MIKLYHGDCLEVMKDIPDKSVDMILCDLPYGTTACKWDNVIPFEPLWEQYNRVVKDNGAIVLFGSQPFSSKLVSSNIDNFLHEWIWEKNNCSNFQNANMHPLKFHEQILVFKSKNYKYSFSKIITSEMEKQKISYSTVSELELSKNGKKTGWLSNKISGLELPTEGQWEKICKLFDIENNYEKMKFTYNFEVDEIYKVCSNKNCAFPPTKAGENRAKRYEGLVGIKVIKQYE